MTQSQDILDENISRLIGAALNMSAKPKMDFQPVMQALAAERKRRRSRRIWFWTGTGAAAAILALTVLVHQRDAMQTGGDHPSVVATQLPEPIPVASDHYEIESALRRYFASVKIRENIIVTKLPDEGLSFSLAGTSVPIEKLRIELASLLRRFEVVNISVMNGQLTYTLAAS